MSERRRIYGIDSIVGNGHDFHDENERYVGSSIDSTFGGQDFYSADGHHVGYSVDSVIGNGQNFYK